MEDKNEITVEEKDMKENKDVQVKNKKKIKIIGISILTIIYSINILPVTFGYFSSLVDELSSNISFYDICIYTYLIIIFLLPYILLVVYFINKEKSTLTTVVVYEIAILLLAGILWLSLPGNNYDEYNNQWENISVNTNK